jgi:sulfite reductase alpha subunit-like flavoprotein
MIGNGVGIAPMRAFCQERTFSIVKGLESPFGETMVLFGTRTKADKLFDWDFETAAKVGALENYHIAFSRETQRPKQYVQELIGENESLILDMLMRRNGVVYVCGSNPLRKGVIEALNSIFSKHSEPLFAQKLIQDSRLMFECFGGGS